MSAAAEVPSLRADLRERGRAFLARWADDPVLFAREVLKTELHPRQAELVRSVVDHPAVACRGAHKVGKSTALSVICLWWVCTRPRARVIITASSHRQVEKVLWKEIRRLHQRAAKPLKNELGQVVRRGIPIGGELHANAESGLQLSDGREVIGFATNEPEKMAGFSGPNQLFVCDEASGIPNAIFEAIEGNRAQRDAPA